MKLTRIDLNSWIFQIAGHTVLVDPWLVDPLEFYGLSWLYTAEHNTPLAITPETLPPIDLILLSQGVDDHCHKPTLEKLDHTIPVIASPAAAKVVTSLGFQKVISLSHWQDVEVTETLQITAVLGAPLQPGQVENGYLLKDLATGETLYYEPHLAPFQEPLRQRLGQVDVAIAPVIGQKFPLLGQVIMGPEEALQLVKILQPDYFVPTAMGDIRISGILPMFIQSVGSVEEFRDRLIASSLPTKLLVPDPGQTLDLGITGK